MAGTGAIAGNLERIAERMAAACVRSGRTPGDARLVAVTKAVGPDEIRELYRLGVRDFGENRVADGIAHKEALGRDDAAWHLIGHLQRNKARAALLGGFRRIHSVESGKLLAALECECGKLDSPADILIEVNVSGEESKYGVAPGALSALAHAAMEAGHLRLVGLMAMAPFSDDPEDARPVFRGLRLLRDGLAREIGVPLPHLSMGMTGDFEVAIEEGATLVRVGTALFVQEPIDKLPDRDVRQRNQEKAVDYKMSKHGVE